MHMVDAKCIMEGAGALIAYGSNQAELQGVIDIGGQTTDLFVANGQRPRSANCKGFSLGVAAAADRLNEKFRETYGTNLSLEARNDLLQQHVNRRPYRIVRDSERKQVSDIELRGLIGSALREVGQEIATQVAVAWSDILSELVQVLIVGGGAHYFASDIQTRLAHAKRSEYKPEMANAFGYTLLAERMMQRAASNGQIRGA